MIDIGTKASDDIIASPEDDIIILKAGDDTVDAGDGDDIIVAGKGDDNVIAGAGDDLLILGAGDDTANGGSGSDTILGGAGDDVFIFDASSFEEGSDFIDGGKDYDTIRIIYTDATADDLAADFERLQAYIDAGDFSKSFHFEAVDLEIRNVENFELVDETPHDPAVLTLNGANPINVGTIFFGSETNVQLTLSNSGGTTATEITVSFTDFDPYADPFSLRTRADGLETPEDWALVDTLDAGDSDAFTVRFMSDNIGIYDGMMTISYFDGYEYQTVDKGLHAQAI